MITADLADLADRLRAAGMVVAVPRLATAAEALIMTPWLAVPSPYWPLRLTLCGRRTDLAVFDAVYAGWHPRGDAEEPARAEVPGTGPATVAVPTTADPARTLEGIGGAAHQGPLAQRPLHELTAAEKAQVAALIGALRPTGRPRRAPRRAPARSGRVDAARTVKLMIHYRGEPTRLRRSRRDRRPRRLLFLIDVSRSMEKFVDVFLLFAHAALMAGPRTTEVFTIGNRWTRITAELSAREPQDAMDALDRGSQGTEIGLSIESFLRRWSNHRAVRAAVVVICSDGADSDPDRMPRQIARLSRIAHRIVWVNPARRYRNYRPQPALRRSLRHTDEQLTGHTLNELHALVEAITR